MISLGQGEIIVIATASLITAMIHGATGLAGGVLMVAILSHIIGVKQAVPVMACALLIGHFGRMVLYWRDTDERVARRILLFGCPSVVLGAYVFKLVDATLVSLLFVVLLATALPIRHWASRRKLRTGPGLLSVASVIWGALAGNVVGQGFFLAPFLLGTGMSRLSFVGTLATVTFVISLLRILVFSLSDVLNSSLLLLGLLIGLISLPGSWLGRQALQQLSNSAHEKIIDVMTLGLIANFIVLFMVD